MAENLNGDDDTTHTYVVFYENNAAYVKWSIKFKLALAGENIFNQ